MGLDETLRYFCAFSAGEESQCNWFLCAEFARDHWPTAQRIIDCTDIPMDEFKIMLETWTESLPDDEALTNKVSGRQKADPLHHRVRPQR